MTEFFKFFIALSIALTIIVIYLAFRIDELECTLGFYLEKSDNVKKKLYEDSAYYRGYEDALQDMRNLLNKEEKPTPPTCGADMREV